MATTREATAVEKWLEYLTKGLLLITLVVPPFVILRDLFFPFVSGRIYIFRFLVELSLFFWLLLIARKPEFRPRLKNPVVLGTLLFIAGLIITGFLGVDPARSFFSNIERADGIVQFAHWVVYFLMVGSVMRTRRDWLVFLGTFVAVAIAVAGVAWKWQEPRLAGVFNNPSYLAAFMLFAIGLTAILWRQLIYRRINNNLNNRSKDKEQMTNWLGNIFFAGLIVFFFATLIFTQTRGVYLGFGVGFTLFTLLALIFLRKRYKKLTFGSTALLLIFLATIGFAFVFKETSFVTGNQILNRITDISFVKDVAAVRERYLAWGIALQAFRDKPIFGWGPENFDVAFNAHYNFLAAKDESWFDSSHNQAFDVLTEGGLVGFSLYLFWIVAVFYALAKIFRRNENSKLIASILASTYLAFLVQGWFLFDTFPFYLGLFPMLGFIYYKYERTISAQKPISAVQGKALEAPWIYVLAGFLLIFTPLLIFKSVWQPYQANQLLLKYHINLEAGRYETARNYFEQASRINSPFTNVDVGNQAGWSMLYHFDSLLGKQIAIQDPETFRDLYGKVVRRAEQSYGYRPLEPQTYYLLGRLYKNGFDFFGFEENLPQAEAILNKGRELAYYRAEYVSELAEVLFRQKRFEELERIVKEHASSIGPPYSHVFIGNVYFLEGKYDSAAQEYRKAEETGFLFWLNDVLYTRYMVTSEQIKDYGTILRLSQELISRRGPTAEAYFNQAVAYYYLGDREEARRAYLKAVAADRSYEIHAQFFLE